MVFSTHQIKMKALRPVIILMAVLIFQVVVIQRDYDVHKIT